MSLNQTSGVITCDSTNGICNTLDEAGSGLGLLMKYIVSFLPEVLIVVGVTVGIVAIVMGIASGIKGVFHSGFKMR